jgi:replicative DNA helicase
MNKLNRDDLSYLGIDYQNRLIAQILTDRRFANSIIDIINPNYFKDQFLKIIVAVIKDAKATDDIVPDIGSIEFRLLENVKDELQQKYVIKTLAKIKESDLYDSLKVQDVAMKFCRYQELKKSLKEMEQILDRGEIEDYEKCEAVLRKALDHGNLTDDGMNVFDNIKEALADDFRKPIRTGIEGLDKIMDGGLSKGELAIILAPFGVGKTTMVTKIANTAVTDGYNVLQIFFEDNPKVIQRKHLSCWSGLELNSLSSNRDSLIEMCDTSKNKDKIKGVLKLKKFSSDGTTIPIIRQYIRRLIAQGFRPDLVLLDYIDCVQPSLIKWVVQ